jgi:hypothetical protein
VENAASLVYNTVHVALPKVKESVNELTIRPIGPVGYVFHGDTRADAFDVCVPPDSGIPIRLQYAKTK